MKAAFVLSHSPGPWRARRLDSADVDSRVWLSSTRTYIAFAVPSFFLFLHGLDTFWASTGGLSFYLSFLDFEDPN